MARRRSRSSRVSRKSSRRGIKTMKRSKVSRKRSRVSRKRSRVSRTNRTRKRSRVLRNKRGGARWMRKKKSPPQLHPLGEVGSPQETESLTSSEQERTDRLHENIERAESEPARWRQLARMGSTKAPDRPNNIDAEVFLGDLTDVMRTAGAGRDSQIATLISENQYEAKALFVDDDVLDWKKKLFKKMGVTRAEVEEAVKKTADVLKELSVNQVKALRDRRVKKTEAIAELKRLAASELPEDKEVALKLFELAIKGVGAGDAWPDGYAGYYKYRKDIKTILPPTDPFDPLAADYEMLKMGK